MTEISVGYVQFEPRLGAIERNRERVAAMVREAPEADLLVLPELCFSGYRFESKDEAWEFSEPASTASASVELLTALARERGTVLVAGLCERDENTTSPRLLNSAVAVGRDGLLAVYRKMHLFWDEKDIFEPGESFEVTAIPLRTGGEARVGILICFDWAFVEAWRTMMVLGADVVAHPSNLVLPEKCQRAVPVMAMMNRIGIVTTNRWGTERDLRFTGESLIALPDGSVAKRAQPEGDAIAVATIDLATVRDRQITPRNHLMNDRRPELYGQLTERTND